MRKSFLAVTVFGCLLFAGACAAADAPAAGTVKMTGTFVWDHQPAQNHPLTAIFTPNGDKKWTAVFTFDWGPKGAQSWKGTAEGDLKTGEVKGEGFHPDGRRKFTYSGKFKDGKLVCSHNETTSGAPAATGTMTLSQ